MVKEIGSKAEFDTELKYAGLVVVDFFTTWCGPCKAIAPWLDQISAKYPEVHFIKVDIDQHKEDIPACANISSIPTFHFYVNGELKEQLKGANQGGIEEYINKYKVNPDPFASSSGHKLSSSAASDGTPAMSAREARLRAFDDANKNKATAISTATGTSKSSYSNTASTSEGTQAAFAEDDEDAALAKAMALSLAEAEATGNSNSKRSAPVATASTGTSTVTAATGEDAEFAAAAAEMDAADKAQQDAANTAEWGEEMVPVPVDEGILNQLAEMGFSDVRGRKAIVHGTSLEGAMNWLTEHQDDPDIDQPYMVRKADTIPKVPLTEEEKAARILEIRAKVKAQKEARAKQEKADAITREKERRERDAKMAETQEERQRMARKREAEKQAREKKEALRERERLRAEIARDKEMRKKNKGVLPSVLGIDGYNPAAGNDASAVANKSLDDAPSTATAAASASPSSSFAQPPAAPKADAVPAKRPSSDSSYGAAKQTTATKKASSSSSSSSSNLDPKQKVDAAIATIMRYRTAGDGGNALKLLLTFTNNIYANPDEPKYRSVNPESGPFKAKLAPLVGPMSLLKAVGFEKSEEDGKLKYVSAVPNDVLTYAVTQLTTAEALYRQQNS